MRRAAHPSGCARCGDGADCSAIKYQSLYCAVSYERGTPVKQLSLRDGPVSGHQDGGRDLDGEGGDVEGVAVLDRGCRRAANAQGFGVQEEDTVELIPTPGVLPPPRRARPGPGPHSYW